MGTRLSYFQGRKSFTWFESDADVDTQLFHETATKLRLY